MATLTANKIGELMLRFSTGPNNSLPASGAFDPDGDNSLQFYNPNGIPQFVNVNKFDAGDNFNYYNYSFSNSGFLQWNGQLDYGYPSPPGGVYPSSLYDGTNIVCINMSYIGDTGISDIIWQGQIAIRAAAITDGVISNGLTISTDEYNFGIISDDNFYLPKVISTNGPLGSGAQFGFKQTGDPTIKYYGAFPNGASIDYYQMFDSPIRFSTFTYYDGMQYQTVANNVDDTICYKVSWLPSVIGGAFNSSYDTLQFDEAFLNNDLLNNVSDGNLWFDGTYIYIAMLYDGNFDPQSPYIIKVNQAWTEYELIFISTQDPDVATLINNFIANIDSLYISYSPSDDKIFLTGGVEPPQFYAVGEYVPITPTVFGIGAPPYIPIYNLSCQNFCLPLYKK